MESGKVIGNVNCLDLRKATQESVARISRIGNVNVVLFSRQTAPLLTQIQFGNVNHTIELTEEAAVQQTIGQLIIKRDHFKHQTAPVFLLAVGQMIIEPEVPAAEIEKGLGGLVVVGQLVCPENLAGVIRQKAHITGSTDTYPPLAKVEFNTVRMDEKYLSALADATEIAVIGDLSAPDVLPNQLIEQKLSKLYVSGDVTCHAENAQALQPRFLKSPGELKIVPAGYTLVKKALVLDKINLGYLPSDKLYCTERVQIAADVEAGQLDKVLSGLICERELICPEALRSVLAAKCNLFETKAIFYEGELWLVDNEEKLQASRFDYLDGKATLVVFSNLIIQADVEPKLLAERLARVHNFGSIGCMTSAQVGAIKARLGANEGVFRDWSAPKEEVEEESNQLVGNVNFLAL